MSYAFRPASSYRDRHGLFIALVGSTNSGKTFSALRLARGIAGPEGKIAVIDTEGGRTLHLKEQFAFDVMMMDPPFRPGRFADAARQAEEAGYACLVIDSFSMEWAGLGGVLEWAEEELQRMAGDDFRKRERVKMASWIKPKGAHKAMVYSFLQRRMPIVFAIRGEETVKPSETGGSPVKTFKTITDKKFPFEVTVSFRLASDRKGIIDLSDPSAWKMEGAHAAIFHDGEQLSESHGEALARWALGETPAISQAAGATVATSGPASGGARSPEVAALVEEGNAAAERGMDVLKAFWGRLSPAQKAAVGGAAQLATWKEKATEQDDGPRDVREAPDGDQGGQPEGAE